MRYFTSDGEIEKKPKYYTKKEEEEMENIKLKKRGAAITFLSLALALALVIGAWLYTDFAYGDDGDGTTTNTEAVNNDNGGGGENTPEPAQSNDTDNNQAVQVQQTEPEGNDVQSVETPTVDQDEEQQTGNQVTPQPRVLAMSNPQPMIKYVSTDMYYATSFGSPEGSIAMLDRTASGGNIPLDRAFLVAYAWQPEWGHDINPDNPKEAMEFTGEIIDEFGNTFYDGDEISTDEVIQLLADSGVNSMFATYKLYAQYVTRVVPDAARVIGIDGVDSGSFVEEYTGDWTYKMWFYGNKNERYVGDFTLPEPGEVDGYAFLYWYREDGNAYYPGDHLTLSSYDFDEDGCMYLTAVWEDADGNIVTELPEKPEEPDTPDDPEVIDPTDEDADDDAEFETVYTETIEVNTEAKAESKAEANEEVTSVDSPATGDGHPILGWTIVFILALAGILGGIFRKKN